jgi:hypothetical protein
VGVRKKDEKEKGIEEGKEGEKGGEMITHSLQLLTSLISPEKM